jgi:hypothetical protein
MFHESIPELSCPNGSQYIVTCNRCYELMLRCSGRRPCSKCISSRSLCETTIQRPHDDISLAKKPKTSPGTLNCIYDDSDTTSCIDLVDSETESATASPRQGAGNGWRPLKDVSATRNPFSLSKKAGATRLPPVSTSTKPSGPRSSLVVTQKKANLVQSI